MYLNVINIRLSPLLVVSRRGGTTRSIFLRVEEQVEWEARIKGQGHQQHLYQQQQQLPSSMDPTTLHHNEDFTAACPSTRTLTTCSDIDLVAVM
jgi:hypothetical protein